ncbi:MAG: Hsp20 family protein [Alphaproteobacteria bacterium]|nr:Hsp20 family protein [Alphaproteobacteria bacterium]MCB1550899.1 Hsp20 family protein [Alphaproteobacteria bacterium]MCB9985784.1 Hsp20 family protein [Micavibrio sp.]HRK97584.1 Hsp20 family protein [Alphaproteobacteria bacterium]
MTSARLSLFDSPLFLGFDQFERTIDRVRKSAQEGYPPYNIEQIGSDGLRITLAVAGFTMDDLDVEIEHNQLTIRGHQRDDADESDRIFLHRGIAARQFLRSFILADGIEIAGATLNNGLLHIDMKRILPESTARKIRIQTGLGKENTMPVNKQITQKAIEVDEETDGENPA